MKPDLDQLFRNERERLLALGLQLTGHPAMAEDAVQEAFLLAHRFSGSFRGEAAASTWLYRIVIRVATKLRERELAARRRDRGSITPPEPQTSHGSVSMREQVIALYRAMAALPADHRTALARLSLRGLPAARIAEILEVPEGTIYSRAYAARRSLREKLDGAR
ncbi:MAG: RNA polymerase sigma factor [Phycisphaerales bacterium JB050]